MLNRNDNLDTKLTKLTFIKIFDPIDRSIKFTFDEDT